MLEYYALNNYIYYTSEALYKIIIVYYVHV